MDHVHHNRIADRAMRLAIRYGWLAPALAVGHAVYHMIAQALGLGCM